MDRDESGIHDGQVRRLVTLGRKSLGVKLLEQSQGCCCPIWPNLALRAALTRRRWQLRGGSVTARADRTLERRSACETTAGYGRVGRFIDAPGLRAGVKPSQSG